ncbi:hypothetical protein FKM82_029406 [Ascaphus truei]
MASRPDKRYHDEGFDPKKVMEIYFGAEKTDTKEELMHYPLRELFKILTPGSVRGDTLIDLSFGAVTTHLLIACDYFKEITMLESSDVSIREIEKWLKKEPGAVDSSHAAMFICELEDNPLDPVVLPQADCLISMWYLGAASKDHDSYLSNLKKCSSLLKVGGHLIMFGLFNISYIMIDQHKLSVLTYDEEFTMKALRDTGYIIKSFEKRKSNLSTHMLDHEHVGYFVACKEREV